MGLLFIGIKIWLANYRIKRGKTKVGVAVTLLISFRFKCDRWVIITLKLRDVLFISISCLRIVSNSLICHLWNLKRLVIITETAINCLLPSSSEISIISKHKAGIDIGQRNKKHAARKSEAGRKSTLSSETTTPWQQGQKLSKSGQARPLNIFPVCLTCNIQVFPSMQAWFMPGAREFLLRNLSLVIFLSGQRT